jgi:phage baseplate assembly protein W
MVVIKKYTDIDMSLGMTAKGDIRKKVNVEAINQHLKMLILTEQDDIPFLNNISADVRNLLFLPYSQFIADTLKNVIENIIKQFEPRITVDEIIVQMEDHNLTASISYTINQTRLVGVFKTILKRIH